ncbi:thioredoxin domain-containing protein [Rubinisphaera sp.]|uniref:thioredoxin domain-containing protein n=1 Tax=Rubinisphaera sp. TaxID=2024857 RepID=UPI000C0FEA86|nr:thioredoxin domain-containing protein [Rubinisphaera sp.]MBV10098.1 thioredoxin domain-containing protein [Rubinisphaera sp.]HCS52179.1 thioredoxin domain-containing protein [Planctomycetaceae bacterium]|tara:strand:+ start:2229 stop:4304 length:2076 start_codon:yes stop_codon:yes gene_type:complete
MSKTHGEPNRLSHESSPYLQQHAYNPVDWYPWGEAAFAEARKRELPVFLSVGYSACHWCHVMERESFEHPQIAQLMNQWFINVKVDREERPDVDQIYMTAVQLVTGQGGWPMSVFMTPEGEPFFGGTYWPPTSQQGMLGFGEILQRIHDYWTQHREECVDKGREMVEAIDQLQTQQRMKSALNENLLKNAEQKILEAADWQHGGLGQAPKFPHPVDFKLLLRTWKRFGNEKALEFVCLTLDKMADGGIYDHLGGGFARYATDQRWLVPHFEKMLYDNAQLVPVYLDAYLATKNQKYLNTVKETLNYVMREMTAKQGGFYSTQDADSEGVEGKYYVWTKSEIETLLGEDAEIFCACYDVSEHGNWEGHTILNRPKSMEVLIKQLEVNSDELLQVLKRSRETLLNHREANRIPPGRDEKILMAWNGMMLSAFAQAIAIIDSVYYRETARLTADFLLETMRDDQGRLWHSYKDGRCQISGFLDDYACLIEGLTDLSLAVQEERYLQAAVELSETMIAQFYDEESAAFLYTPLDHEQLIVRIRDQYDNAIPSGTNLAIHALLKVGQLVDNEKFIAVATAALDTVSGTLLHQPTGMCQALLALDRHLGPTSELICLVPDNETVSKRFHQLSSQYAPLTSVVVQSAETPTWSLLNAKFQGKTTVEGKVTVYHCTRGRCDEPWIGGEQIEKNMSFHTT